MKRLVFIMVAGVTCMLHSRAQYADPLVYIRIPKEQIPQVVESAFDIKFNRDDPVTWSKFPFALEKFGWIYDIGADNLELSQFEVELRTSIDTDYRAVYTNSGELVRAKEVTTNKRLPASVLSEFLNSQYKDWKIVNSKEIIYLFRDPEDNSADVLQDFRIRVEKEGVKRNINFKWKGSANFPAYYTNVNSFIRMPYTERIETE